MNDNHSNKDIKYINRWFAETFRSAIKAHPVVVLTGARQVGKSTFLRHEEALKDWAYHSFDHYDTLALAEKDPSALTGESRQVIFDEVQRAPAFLEAIKKAVDENERTARFVLSGSANLLLMRQVSESLAGRAVFFVLSPMALGELHHVKKPDLLQFLLNETIPKEQRYDENKGSNNSYPFLLTGFMPPTLEISEPSEVIRWWEGYVASYLERDLRQISQVDSLVDFRRFMETLALRTGMMINQTEISRDTRISQASIHRYLNLLEATHIIERLPAFAENRTKRLIKTPKFYWLDPALAVFLSGYHSEDDLARSREKGSFFENLVFHHLRILANLEVPKARLSYWRTASGDEVDFVMEHGRKLLAFEVKLTASPHVSDAANLVKFMKEYPRTSLGVFVHSGNAISRLGSKIIAVPWTYLANGKFNT